MERKLATIRTIERLEEIDGADKIELAIVDGWQVVVKKGVHTVGEQVVYLEIDSWVPHTLAPFLTKESDYPKIYLNVDGQRLKTIKLRGQISQGLILSLDDANVYQESPEVFKFTKADGTTEILSIDADLTELLGILKYEKLSPEVMSGKSRGNFPSCGRKTDQERCQNMKKYITHAIDNDEMFEISIKMDGSSFSILKDLADEVHVCSRNLSKKIENEGDAFVNVARKYDLITKVQDYETLIQISGELCGPSIQGNKDALTENDLFVFDIFDVKAGKYMSPDDRMKIVNEFGLKHVPILHAKVTLKEIGINSIEDMIKFANGAGYNSKIREGVVFKSHDRDFSFKAISNDFLLKYGE